MSPAPPPDRSWITPTVPTPGHSDWFGRLVCQTMDPVGTSGRTSPCGKRFWFPNSYRHHWEQEHRPRKRLPKVQPGPAPGSLSLEEEGRRLASRRDNLIALGVPPHMLAIPLAPRHSSPFNVKNALVMHHGEHWAPAVINIDGVNYVRYDIDRDPNRKDT
jgi:hypothetical protein